METETDLLFQEIEENPQYAGIIEEAFEIVKSLNISVNGFTSTEAPIVPRDITNIPDYELGELLNQFTAWAGYIEQKLSEYNSFYTIMENELEFVVAYLHSILISQASKNTKVTERKELIRTDKRYIHVNREKLKYEVVVNILKASLNANNNICFNLSRQITLKSQDEYRQNRSHNISNLQMKPAMPSAMKPKALLHAPAGPPPTPRRKSRE